jgi:hypothetical protein
MAEKKSELLDSRVSRYREKAIAARDLAAEVKDADVRKQFYSIAAAYELLAECIEHLPALSSAQRAK